MPRTDAKRLLLFYRNRNIVDGYVDLGDFEARKVLDLFHDGIPDGLGYLGYRLTVRYVQRKLYMGFAVFDLHSYARSRLPSVRPLKSSPALGELSPDTRVPPV